MNLINILFFENRFSYWLSSVNSAHYKYVTKVSDINFIWSMMSVLRSVPTPTTRVLLRISRNNDMIRSVALNRRSRPFAYRGWRRVVTQYISKSRSMKTYKLKISNRFQDHKRLEIRPDLDPSVTVLLLFSERDNEQRSLCQNRSDPHCQYFDIRER